MNSCEDGGEVVVDLQNISEFRAVLRLGNLDSTFLFLALFLRMQINDRLQPISGPVLGTVKETSHHFPLQACLTISYRIPSPALPKFPLQWVTQAISYPEANLPNLIGVDASTYIRFLQGCSKSLVPPSLCKNNK